MLRQIIILLVAAFACLPALSNTTAEWVASNSHHGLTPADANKIVNEAISAGSRHGVDPILILAVMRKESGYRQTARSKEGATCMMQVIPKWHREKIGKRNLRDLPTCVDVGALILKEYLILNRQDIRKALRKYSGGDKAYAGSILAWRAKIVMETRDGGVLLAALTAQ